MIGLGLCFRDLGLVRYLVDGCKALASSVSKNAPFRYQPWGGLTSGYTSSCCWRRWPISERSQRPHLSAYICVSSTVFDFLRLVWQPGWASSDWILIRHVTFPEVDLIVSWGFWIQCKYQVATYQQSMEVLLKSGSKGLFSTQWNHFILWMLNTVFFLLLWEINLQQGCSPVLQTSTAQCQCEDFTL